VKENDTGDLPKKLTQLKKQEMSQRKDHQSRGRGDLGLEGKTRRIRPEGGRGETEKEAVPNGRGTRRSKVGVRSSLSSSEGFRIKKKRNKKMTRAPRSEKRRSTKLWGPA